MARAQTYDVCVEMFGPDLSAAVDPEPFARLLATPAFDVAACRRAIEAFLRTNTANIHDITAAFKAFVGNRLVDHKPRMIELLSYTLDGLRPCGGIDRRRRRSKLKRGRRRMWKRVRHGEQLDSRVPRMRDRSRDSNRPIGCPVA